MKITYTRALSNPSPNKVDNTIKRTETQLPHSVEQTSLINFFLLPLFDSSCPLPKSKCCSCKMVSIIIIKTNASNYYGHVPFNLVNQELIIILCAHFNEA